MNEAVRVLRELQAEGVIRQFALGGAAALVFYTEPVLTYDLDFFVIVDAPPGQVFSMQPLYEHLRRKGCTVAGEQVMIGGAPVQVLIAYNPLVEEAVREARELPFNGERVPVMTPEYLIAIALQTNRYKDRERVHLLQEQAAIDEAKLNDILTQHGLIEVWETIRRKR
ncbi:MAG: hypothetical protein NZL85_02295 [Fimbriimonadales bacterium]|nr:hypothetical protein [Fimbriimonadales bacterium]